MKWDNKIIVLGFTLIIQIMNTESLDHSHARFLSMSRKITCQMHLSKITKRSWTIVIDEDRTLDEIMKNDMIKEFTLNLSTVILKEEKSQILSLHNIIKYHTKNCNLVFIVENISKDVLNSAVLKLISKWSLVYFIVTTSDTLYSCDNGTLQPKAEKKVEDFLNFMWHRYLIVWGIVEFPFICPCHYVIYEGKRLSNTAREYDRQTKLITAYTGEELNKTLFVRAKTEPATEGFPLRANSFYRFPTSITECSGLKYYVRSNFTDKFCGMDGMVLNDVVERFKFNVNFSLHEYCNSYGYKLPNDVVSGSLGCIIRKEIDVSFNSRFMVRYLNNEDRYIFLQYVSIDSLCAVVKLPDFIPLWHYAYDCFGIYIWLTIITVLAIIGIVMWVAEMLIPLDKKTSRKRRIGLLNVVIDSIISGLFGFSLKKTRFIFKGPCFIGSIMFSAIYQGYINYVFTTMIRYPTVKSLSELKQSGTTLYTSPSIDLILRTKRNEQLDWIKLWPKNNTDNLKQVLMYPNTATLERRSDVALETMKYYEDNNGRPLLYVVEDCLRTHYLSYIAEKEFLFTKKLILFLERLNEAGLPAMYYEWTKRALNLNEATSTQSQSEPRPTSKISLQDQRIAFSILSFGYVLSILIFVVEKITFKRSLAKMRV